MVWIATLHNHTIQRYMPSDQKGNPMPNYGYLLAACCIAAPVLVTVLILACAGLAGHDYTVTEVNPDRVSDNG